MNRDPWLKALIILLVIIAASYLAGLAWAMAVRFADILLLLILAWVLAFALEPVTQFLENRTRISRGPAVAFCYLGLLIVLSLATLLIVPVIAVQISQIGTNLPDYAMYFGARLADLNGWFLERGIILDNAILLDYKEVARRAESLGPVIVNNALAMATGLASLLFSLVLVLILSFYIMLDGNRIARAFLLAVPADLRSDINYLFISTHRAFGGYIRGQLIQALVYGAATAVVMLLADLPYTAVASIFATAIMMIPFIGPVLAMIPPVLIVAFVYPMKAWWVFLLLLLIQQVVLNVLAPKVMSKSVGMHPLLVLLALLVGSKLAGAWGAIFAIPVAGVLVAMVSFYRMTVDERKIHLEEETEVTGRPKFGEIKKPQPQTTEHR